VSRLWAALAATALGFGWQWLTVARNYGGNFTALFCTGSQHPTPSSLAGEHIYVFPNSGGYDGQSYHYVAHDPLGRTDIGRAVPDPEFRYPRILLPALAYLAALGRQQWIDPAYFACNLWFLFLGAWWLAPLLERVGLNPRLAVLYAVAPVTIVALDRLVIDLALVSLCLGFAVYVESGPRWKLYAVLLAAALCRDSGFLLTAACVLPCLRKRRFREAALLATAVLPAVAWMVYVRTQIHGGPHLGIASFIPVWSMLRSVMDLPPYRFPPLITAAVRAFDALELAGIFLAMAVAFRGVREFGREAIGTACFLWACFATAIPQGAFNDCYAEARLLSPLLFFLPLWKGRAVWFVPMLLAAPRVWLELAPQVLGLFAR